MAAAEQKRQSENQGTFHGGPPSCVGHVVDNLGTRPRGCDSLNALAPPWHRGQGASSTLRARVAVDGASGSGFNGAMRLSLTFVVVVAASLACSGRRIPGTDIKDTADTRAIVAVIDQYRAAAERRDPAAVMALVSRKYFDDAGTPDPADDVDYEQLKQRLSSDFAKLTALKLDIGVRGVEVDDDKAAAYVYYDEHYRIATSGGEVPRQASDSHRMRFVREAGTWKFVSGL
jgi:ketosteroid isomerase-like protein